MTVPLIEGSFTSCSTTSANRNTINQSAGHPGTAAREADLGGKAWKPWWDRAEGDRSRSCAAEACLQHAQLAPSPCVAPSQEGRDVAAHYAKQGSNVNKSKLQRDGGRQCMAKGVVASRARALYCKAQSGKVADTARTGRMVPATAEA